MRTIIQSAILALLMCVFASVNAQNLKRGDGDKYITADDISFQLEEGDITEEYFKSEQAMKKKKSTSTSANEDEIIESSYELKGLLLEYLVELNYLDTTDRFFPDYKNSLHLDMVVEELHMRLIKPGRSSPITVAYIELVSEFTLKSHYGKELLKKTVTQEERLQGSYNFEEGNVFVNLIEASAYEFIFDEEVQALVTSKEYFDLEDEASFEPISINSKLGSANPVDWKDGVATIISDEGHGSACVISEDGYLITNFHVVGQKDMVKVKFSNGDVTTGIVVRKQPDCDLALVKVNNTGLKFLPVAKVPTDFGDAVYVLGTPADTLLANSLFKGVLSGKRNFDGATYLQTDAKVNLGNSGGALLNANGELIGVVSSKYVGYGIEGIGFAIPAEEIQNKLKVEFKAPVAPAPVVAPSKPKKKK